MISRKVCPECGAPVPKKEVHVSGPEKAFERYHCDSCGADMLTEDLVTKRAYSHAHGHIPYGGGGNVTTAQGFPRNWIYYATPGNGSPLRVSANVLSQTVINAIAKWDLSTVNVSPFTNSDEPNLHQLWYLLKSQNPNHRMLWYYQLTNTFQNLNPAGISLWGDAYAIASGAELIRNTDGQNFPDGGSLGGYWDASVSTKATAFLNVWKNFGQGNSDGYFHDYMISKPANWNVATIDYGAAGYADVTAMNASTDPAFTSVLSGLDATGELQYGNRGFNFNLTPDAATFAYCDGELFENWVSPGPSFDTMMGLTNLWQGSSPTGFGSALIYQASGGLTQADGASYEKLVRFILGSACVCGGYGAVGNGRLDANDYLLLADEYAVDSSGHTDTSMNIANKGWLGMPTEFGAKDASGLWVRRFQRGIVLVNGTTGNLTMSLGRNYQRIFGVYDTSASNGAVVSSQTVPGQDARFLRAI